MIERILYKKIKTRLFKGKAIIILGPRRVGKTTLLKKIEAQIGAKTIFLDGMSRMSERNLLMQARQ